MSKGIYNRKNKRRGPYRKKDGEIMYNRPSYTFILLLTAAGYDTNKKIKRLIKKPLSNLSNTRRELIKAGTITEQDSWPTTYLFNWEWYNNFFFEEITNRLERNKPKKNDKRELVYKLAEKLVKKIIKNMQKKEFSDVFYYYSKTFFRGVIKNKEIHSHLDFIFLIHNFLDCFRFSSYGLKYNSPYIHTPALVETEFYTPFETHNDSKLPYVESEVNFPYFDKPIVQDFISSFCQLSYYFYILEELNYFKQQLVKIKMWGDKK
jgi:hypothetical protein